MTCKDSSNTDIMLCTFCTFCGKEWRSCCGKFIDTRKIHDEQVDKAGIDILLVGDSAGMVVHGFDTTLPLTLDMMLVHCQAVSRGTGRPFLIGDMPFGTYEISAEQAVDTAVQFLKVGNVDAVKLEGKTQLTTERSSAYAQVLVNRSACERSALQH